jgi:SAM-dependent methyltransferase
MKRELLGFLVCPSCKNSLELGVLDEIGEEIINGDLRCTSCYASYPIQQGVPRFVPSQLETSAVNTSHAFTYEWESFSDRLEGTLFTQRDLFLDFVHPVNADYFEDKVVLDAGCGMGRFSRLAAEFGARQVVGVDLGHSVDVAYQRLRSFPNIHIVQADILSLPLKQDYQYIFSIGVLHHTVDPRRSFEALLSLLQTKGGISVWVYGRENNGWIIHVLNPIRTKITSKMPHWALNTLSYPLAASIRLIANGVYKPISGNTPLQSLWKWLPYREYLVFFSQFSFHEQRTDVFDHLAPELAFYIARPEFEAWFLENGLAQVSITQRTGNSWRGFGVKTVGDQ